ncbi:tyrosine-protein phosphatase [Streptococcus pneumoniae]|uniref:tyrosine-protein phosphatase n=1 Tax=Streptococcus pneumoniae TaxID=1313 RepID=UPI00125D3310|nr:tyrosine-protein phosphatase [Streptococcus pneumoniae]
MSILWRKALNNLTLLKEYNFRDLGNHLTQTGQKIKPKTLFRSSKLFGISKIDVDLLQSYGITKVIDFRSANEIKKDSRSRYKKYKKYSNSNIL